MPWYPHCKESHSIATHSFFVLIKLTFTKRADRNYTHTNDNHNISVKKKHHNIKFFLTIIIIILVSHTLSANDHLPNAMRH